MSLESFPAPARRQSSVPNFLSDPTVARLSSSAGSHSLSPHLFDLSTFNQYFSSLLTCFLPYFSQSGGGGWRWCPKRHPQLIREGTGKKGGWEDYSVAINTPSPSRRQCPASCHSTDGQTHSSPHRTRPGPTWPSTLLIGDQSPAICGTAGHTLATSNLPRRLTLSSLLLRCSPSLSFLTFARLTVSAVEMDDDVPRRQLGEQSSAVMCHQSQQGEVDG